MTIQDQIESYLAAQPPPKQGEMRALHDRILGLMPGADLWFLDGRDETGKVVSNPNIGYGRYRIDYAGGKTRDFYRIGLSGNTTGVSVYVMGLADKTELPRLIGDTIGKASVSGYCVKFKALKDIDLEVLDTAIRHGAAQD